MDYFSSCTSLLFQILVKPSSVNVGIEKLETCRSHLNHNVWPTSLCAGKVVRLRQQLMGAADAVKGLFGQKKQQDQAVEKLEALRVSLSSDYRLRLPNEVLKVMAGAEEELHRGAVCECHECSFECRQGLRRPGNCSEMRKALNSSL